MVLLVARLSKLYSKLENHHHFHLHHHHESESLSASLQAFRSDVSNCLNRLSMINGSKPGLETMSLSFFHQCFELLPMINKVFGKLVVSIDHPLSRWEAASVEEYLSYTLHLLELLNSISSSISHLGQARLSLCHALTLVETSPDAATEHLKAIDHLSSSKDHGDEEEKKEEDGEKRISSGKELVIHEALMVMKGIGYWVCGVVLSGLSGDAKPYLEMREKAGGFANSPLAGLDSSVCEIVRNRGGMLMEVKEVKDAVTSLVAAMANGESSSDDEAEELRRRLELFEKLMEGLRKDVDCLFSEVLAGRNKLLDGLRPMKQ